MAGLPAGVYRLDVPEKRFYRTSPAAAELAPDSDVAGVLELLAAVALPYQLLRDLGRGPWRPYVDLVGVVDGGELREKGSGARTCGVALLLRDEGFSLLASRDSDPHEVRTGTKYLRVGAEPLEDTSGNYAAARELSDVLHVGYRGMLQEVFGAEGPVLVDFYLPGEGRDCIFAYARPGPEPLELESRRGGEYAHSVGHWLQELLNAY